jgi:hypothetical protein
MGIYSNTAEDYEVDMNALIEAFLIDDLTHNYGEDTIQEFCAPGGVGEALVEAKVLSTQKTVNRISKKDDYTRRVVITCINMARQHKDPLYAKLVKYQLLRKQARKKIVEKYGSRAKKVALKAQREYIKSMKGVNLSNNIAQAGSITHDNNR